VTPVLELEGFGVAFAARTILLDVSLSIPAQGCTVLLGPSGTGKSTLIRTLAGLNDANSSMHNWGRAIYRGMPLCPARRPAIVTQKAYLLMATVQDNMIAKLPQRSSLTRVSQIEHVRDFLLKNGQDVLADKLTIPVIDLPQHEQRIIAILRQALPEPALLMVDEPTVKMSPEGAQAVLLTLEILARSRAVLMVSHHLAQTRQIASKVILLADGIVQESAAKDDFFLCPQSTAAQHYVRTGSCPELGINRQATESDADEALSVGSEPLARLPCEEAKVPPQAVAVTQATAGPAPVLEAWQRQQHLQPSLAAKSAFCGPRGFVWLIGGKVAGTPFPGLLRSVHQDLQALRNAGITRLISLTETPFDAALAANYDIQCTAVPMPDMQAPSLEDAWFLCHEMDRYLENGETVAVHCKAGLGRTGTVLGLYWIWLQAGQVSGAAAMKYVRQQEAGMIQSLEQENFLKSFAGVVAQLSAGTMGPVPSLELDADF
jgi:atypical dual specificity phosphatase